LKLGATSKYAPIQRYDLRPTAQDSAVAFVSLGQGVTEALKGGARGLRSKE
jgi:hypothetical protein